MAHGGWWPHRPYAISHDGTSPSEPYLLGLDPLLDVRRVFARAEAVSILKHPDHPLHLLAVFLRRVLLRVKLLVSREPRRENPLK